MSGKITRINKILKEDDPGYIETKTPFTASPYYDFADEFLLGLKLETYFDNAEECTNALIYMIDDYTYFQNNITLSKGVQWEAPFFNFTRAIAGNFSASIVECEQFAVNWWQYNVNKFAEFNNNVGDFLLSFLFNLMGNSLSFKSIFNEINDDMAN